MGLCASQKSAHRDVISPQGDSHAQIEHEFSVYLNLDNPYNVNHKYTYLYKPIKESFQGKGIKKTHAYKSLVSLEEIKSKRKEFWETWVEGVIETWNALKLACDQEEINDNTMVV